MKQQDNQQEDREQGGKGSMDIGYIKNATPDFELLEAKCDEWIRWHENKE